MCFDNRKTPAFRDSPHSHNTIGIAGCNLMGIVTAQINRFSPIHHSVSDRIFGLFSRETRPFDK